MSVLQSEKLTSKRMRCRNWCLDMRLAIAAMSGPLVFIFLLAKGLRGKAFTKEASLHLVVSAGLLAILLTASRQFGWLDVSVSTAAMLPVVLGMYVGQQYPRYNCA